MSEKPKFAAEWFEWFQKEELPRIYRAEKGLPPSKAEVDDAMRFLREQLTDRYPSLRTPMPPGIPLEWKLGEDADEDEDN